MELRHLRYFVAVAEERHFGRAAERLHIAQPPLSQQVRRLEAELGVELLHRTTRRVELAPAGEVLLSRARSILAAVDAAERDARRAAGGELGRLSVAFTGSTTYALMPAVASSLREGLPGVELELHGEMLNPAQIEGLLDGSLDLGLLRPPIREPALEVKAIRSEPMIAVLPEDHPLAAAEEVPVEQLAGEPFVAYRSHPQSVGPRVLRETCEAHGFVPTIAIEATETSTLVSFVAAGLGVSLVPGSVTTMSISGAVYRPLAGVPARMQVGLAWRRDDDSPVLARAVPIVESVVMARDPDSIFEKSRS